MTPETIPSRKYPSVAQAAAEESETARTQEVSVTTFDAEDNVETVHERLETKQGSDCSKAAFLLPKIGAESLDDD